MTDTTFTLDAAFDRQLFWERGGSVRYLVARLRAARREHLHRPERSPLNLALVIDASGSMRGAKLAAAREAAMGLAERLTERDHLTLVSFSSDVIVHCEGLAMTRDNLEQVRIELRRLSTRGLTDLSSGWFAGVEAAARVFEEDPRLTPRVIILSDGHANRGITNRQELSEHAGELRARGVLTSCLGIGDDYDEQLMCGIAESGGGRLHDAEEAGEIRSVLLGELDDIFGNAVEDARIVLKAPRDFVIEPVSKGQCERSGAHLSLVLGAVQDGVERVAIFKVICPPAIQGADPAFEITASGRSVDDMRRLEAAPVRVALTAASGGANTAQPRDEDLAAIIARMWSAKIVATAARMNRERDYRAAEAYVERELHHFRRYVEGMPTAGTMLREIELLARQVGNELSSRSRKEMMLHEALTTESRSDKRGLGKPAWSARIEQRG
ncbi:MAG: vWA domain-containing protein [Erythrobacter sp.]